jgi:cellulose synthase/poly-beta-1,6-N-acetylglucosamine synthase-like glycosyltransferase
MATSKCLWRLPPNASRLAEGGMRVKCGEPGTLPPPQITIVTPVFNGARFLPRTLHSLADQAYRGFEHIVVDGGSTDGTVEILQAHDADLSYWVSEPDAGMYDALSKGFSLARGQILAWLNADDLYYPWTLAMVEKTFSAYPDVDWLTGVASFVDEQDLLTSIQMPKVYFRSLIAAGYYRHDGLGFIQQESTFFRRQLFHRVTLLSTLKLAGDYHLWMQMAQHAPLHTVKTVLASFRQHPGQKSTDLEAYIAECDCFARPHLRFLKYALAPLSVLLEHQMLKPERVRHAARNEVVAGRDVR